MNAERWAPIALGCSRVSVLLAIYHVQNVKSRFLGCGVFLAPTRGEGEFRPSGRVTLPSATKGKEVFRATARPSLPAAAKKAKRRLNLFGSRLPPNGSHCNSDAIGFEKRFCRRRIGVLLLPLPLVHFLMWLTHRLAKTSSQQVCSEAFLASLC